jgi:hypothetical protein
MPENAFDPAGWPFADTTHQVQPMASNWKQLLRRMSLPTPYSRKLSSCYHHYHPGDQYQRQMSLVNLASKRFDPPSFGFPVQSLHLGTFCGFGFSSDFSRG